MSKSSKTINETINGSKKELIPKFRTKFIMLGQARSHCTQTESYARPAETTVPLCGQTSSMPRKIICPPPSLPLFLQQGNPYVVQHPSSSNPPASTSQLAGNTGTYHSTRTTLRSGVQDQCKIHHFKKFKKGGGA